MNKFSFAGLDFIFDKEMRPYFLEANSFPGIFIWHELYKNIKPVKTLEKYLKKRKCENIVLLTPKRYLKTETSINLIKNGLKKLDVHICLIKENEKSIKRNSAKLVDIDGNIIKADSLLRRKPLFKYNPENVIEINSPEVIRVTRNKWLSYLAIRNAFIRSPTSFLVKNMSNVERALKENERMFKKGFVLKPTTGEKGSGIRIVKDISKIDNIEIKKPYLLQKIVNIKKMKGDYWDLRAFVVGGKYIGSMLRVSESPVTNISLGGVVKEVPGEIENKIKKRAEKCVKVIENFSEML
ncbi:MAG: hypothetical protein ISS36_02030 [Candidatus Aenigmarchaeota archaeon]|nr:hypothetical protein [Candidatus Aenigmarchaeota archaeon]